MKNLVTLLALMMLAAPVYATGGGEGNNTGCNGQGNPNSPCNPGGGDDDNGGNGGNGGQGGNGGNGTGVGVGVGVGIGIGGGADVDVSNDNTNTNTNTQGQQQGQIQGQIATGGSVTDSGNSTSVAGAVATGGEGGNASIYIGGAGEGQGEGEGSGGNGAFSNENNVNNSSTATTGDQTVTVNIGEDGPLTASSQEVATSATIEEGAIQIEGDTYQAAEIPVNSAAPSFSAICSSGGAGTGRNFSLSLAVTNDVCQALMVADAYMAMGKTEEAMKWVEAAARHAKWKGGMGYFRHVITLGVM